jgi:hypothetical protein
MARQLDEAPLELRPVAHLQRGGAAGLDHGGDELGELGRG